MKNRFEELLALHQRHDIVLVGNAWNAQSARVLEQERIKVIGTSSAAVADSQGYADGEEMNFDFYLQLIERIVKSVSAIVTVDLEGGYGKTTDHIVANIKALYQSGVSGINIEDSVIVEGERQMLDKDFFAGRLKEICTTLKKEEIKMFINVRSDGYLLPAEQPLQDALTRIEAYQNTGVHGLFFPCLVKIDEMEKIVKKSILPINVMCVPGLPDCETLAFAGIKRVSLGPFLNMQLYRQLPKFIKAIKDTGNFNSLF